MATRFWRPFYIVCGRCGHRNRPSKSPREGIRMTLLNQLSPCRKCGQEFRDHQVPDRPLLDEVRAELAREALAGGAPKAPAPATKPAAIQEDDDIAPMSYLDMGLCPHGVPDDGDCDRCLGGPLGWEQD